MRRPPGFPGSAHAEEHMAFRGCTGMTADQTAAIYAQLGGRDNADTQQNITQYYTTVPAADLDVALHAQAACLRGVDNSEAEWAHERGAIEQEVSRDLSNPTYKFIDRLNADMFAGTPYAHDPLGTRPSFDATTGAMLSDFYKKWYTPGNAILVIVGDVDPAATIAKVKELFGDIANHPVPEHPAVNLSPVKPETFTLDSNLPYVLGFIAYRMPGTDSPDYAAAQILADILASQRADVYGMVPAGKALYATFGMAENYPKASVGYGEIALPAGADATGPINEMRQIVEGYAQKGLPQDLFDAAKRDEIASAEFQRNSIPGLASVWSEALTAEGRNSPDDDLQAIKAVTLADVNRVAKQYLVSSNSITATLKPSPSGEAVAAKGFGGGEKMTSAPTKPVVLPSWAAASLSQLKVPSDYIVASDTTLPNGLRLIVKTDHTSPTVTVVGTVKNNADLQTPKGKEGVSDVLDGLYSYGTQTLDRLAFQKALDDIAANETAGFDFSVQVLKDNFSRGVELLADNELHPALPAEAFTVVKDQTTQFVAGNLKSPGYRTSRALDIALLPPNDPVLREVTPATLGTVTLDDVKQYHAATVRPDLTTIVVIGDTTPDEAKAVITKWFGDLEGRGPQAGHDTRRNPRKQGFGGQRTRSASGAGLRDPGAAAEPQPLRSRLLSAPTGQSRIRRRLLCHQALPRSAPGSWIRLQRGRQHGGIEDPGQLHRDLRLRSAERLQSQSIGPARSRADAHPGRLGRRTAPGQGDASAVHSAGRVKRRGSSAGPAPPGRDRPASGRAHRSGQEVLRTRRRPDQGSLRPPSPARRLRPGSPRPRPAVSSVPTNNPG